MSETKFTAGPWAISFNQVYQPESVAVIATVNGYDEIFVGAADANARLIAAAPMLYAAVANAEAYFSTLPADDAAHSLYIEMNAALAKARGEA